MPDTVIRVENISKKYIIGHQKQERYTVLRDVIANQIKSIGSLINPKAKTENQTFEEFWALQDVSFEIKQGDRVGIIGRNGAGKSTLLKILSRITEPTQGSIKIKGRVASLLEVGTGFHPELTGRENIFLNGAILGMSKEEIKRKFDEIVAFSEVEKFLDTPVKRYSSGMYVRLAFAVAAHLEPEILIVDEVLAVGDAKFQKKCLGKMEDVGKEGRSILFVSHNLGILQTLCNRGILLNQGTVVTDDSASQAVITYLQTLEQSVSNNILDRQDRKGKGEVRLSRLDVSSGDDYSAATLATGRPARFIFYLTAGKPKISCVFTIYDQYGQPVTSFSSINQLHDEDINSSGQREKIICEIDELLLVPGRYRMNVAIMNDSELQDHVEGAAILDVNQGHIRGYPILSDGKYGSICIPHRWS
ncbi:ABC transporter ATP-binding protein [Sphaerospermopsis aphanizomenoides BCCUSP55]|uniref:ABC transporter ATP-binding protein n=1 Tax=Sphaerospermopsis aphanizomenoides TaxID=459663 RepID=UPI001903BED6|nr:ABC transporter ATP-binding protein [Sphaerospermopsis aphanizomenoides]MBK1987100.1 ABC transporter ATP-binding protein [Sphaerospermopsis aphanizomenoides BCCUSP55]